MPPNYFLNVFVPSPVVNGTPLTGGGRGGDSYASAGCHTKYGNHAEVAHASTAGTGKACIIQLLLNLGPSNIV